MKLLQTYIDELRPSRAVFKLEINHYGDTIVAKPVKDTEIVEQKLSEKNVLRDLVYANRKETLILSDRFYRIDTISVEKGCVDDVKEALKGFLEYSGKFRNPRQSKLWKFIYRTNSMSNVDKIEGFLLLYRYLRENGMSDDGRTNYTDSKHVKNALVILEAMREKYEQS